MIVLFLLFFPPSKLLAIQCLVTIPLFLSFILLIENYSWKFGISHLIFVILGEMIFYDSLFQSYEAHICKIIPLCKPLYQERSFVVRMYLCLSYPFRCDPLFVELFNSFIVIFQGRLFHIKYIFASICGKR